MGFRHRQGTPDRAEPGEVLGWTEVRSPPDVSALNRMLNSMTERDGPEVIGRRDQQLLSERGLTQRQSAEPA